MFKLLVIGQTPPPYGGQAMMISRLVNADFSDLNIIHVRMAFSSSFKTMGSSGVRKIFHIFQIAAKVLYIRFKEDVDTFYYPPSGPAVNSLLRDLILLALIRPFFSKHIYHFRAAGISDMLKKFPKQIQYLIKFIYGKPVLAIQLSKLNPADGGYFKSKRIEFIPNGIEDAYLKYSKSKQKANKGYMEILFVGVIKESKGVNIIIEAAKKLKKEGYLFKIIFMGEFFSTQYENEIINIIDKYSLSDQINFVGVKTNHEKWLYYLKADLLCFPTFFESESFGNVIIEAMMFSMPVISTIWRGIPDIVDDGINGYLIPTHDNESLFKKLEYCINNPEIIIEMGKRGRIKYLEQYSLTTHLQLMRDKLIAS